MMHDLQQYLLVILKYRKFIFRNVLIFTLIVGVVSFILPKRYKAIAQILPPTQEPDLLGFYSLTMPQFSANLSSAFAMLGGATPSDLVVKIAESRTIREYVINTCDLLRFFKIKKSSMEKAIKTLNQVTKISALTEGIVRIEVEVESAKKAADIANAYVAAVDKFLRESNMTKGKNMRVFLENRLKEAEIEFKLAQDSLKSFQQKHKVVALDEETKVAIDAYAQLKSRLFVKEIEVGALSSISSENNPILRNKLREIAEFKKKLIEVESGKKVASGFGVGFAVPFKQLPSISADYAQRLMDYKVQEELYTLLVQQYERSRILEARDTPAITVLDYARIPEKKSFPKRLLLIALAFFLSFFINTCLVFVFEYRSYIKREQHEEYKNWIQISKIIKQSPQNFLNLIRFKKNN